jgi:hypothetical protein
MPLSYAIAATLSAAVCAAKEVLFLAPLNPLPPADAQNNVFPFCSVTVTIVLLNVALM